MSPCHKQAILSYSIKAPNPQVAFAAVQRDEKILEELAAIKYKITSRGQVQIESKDEMKRRGLRSPDRADMLAMLFDGAGDLLLNWNPTPLPPSRAAILREEMKRW